MRPEPAQARLGGGGELAQVSGLGLQYLAARWGKAIVPAHTAVDDLVAIELDVTGGIQSV
jgi:hypothetical protein